MHAPVLSIVIPTRNRLTELKSTLINLRNLIHSNLNVEIIVSDNSDIAIDLSEFSPHVKVLRPPSILQTAEENLAFALNEATGNYVWPLGDDDVVLRSGFEKLIYECLSQRYDGFTMNARNVSNDYRAMGWSRVMCFAEQIELSYENFLERIGYWSIPAGISLTVFKRDLLRKESLEIILNSDSKIYSHVTMYAMLFKGKHFAFINTDLVEYRTNLYDVSHQSTNHWISYSSSIGKHDRYFWLNGFIKQLQYLELNSAIHSDYICRTIDIGHFNHRLPLLEHMLGMLLEQISLDLEKRSTITMDVTEVEEVVDYFSSKEPTLIGYYSNIREIYNNDKSDPEKRSLIDRTLENWHVERASYPFRRFYRCRVYGFFIYETPMAWVALPQKISSRPFSVPAVKHLNLIFLGIDIPKFKNAYAAESFDSLVSILRKVELDSELLSDVEEFQFTPAIFKTANGVEKVNLIRKLWRRLPLKLKVYLKVRLLGK